MTVHNRDIQTDVSDLGEELGDVLRQQTSDATFDTVETIRQKAIRHRDQAEAVQGSLRSEIDTLGSEQAQIVSRAFTTYFELINLAEERERVRAIRRASQDGQLDDGLRDVFDQFAAEEIPPETVQRIMSDVSIEPTFTAHPTEARRKTVKAKLRRIADDLEALDERLLTDTERADRWSRIDTELTSLWETPQVRSRQPEPLDEARNVHWYLEQTLFDVVGDVHEAVDRVVDDAYDADFDVPELFSFRSWAGSDRDGNPYVTPDVTSETLARQRRIALDRYRGTITDLRERLSQATELATISDELAASLATAEAQTPGLAEAARHAYPDEPYRQKLQVIRERLDRVDDVRPGGYDDADAFDDDLAVVAESLRESGAESVASGVDRLRREVATFGFHLASLDLRDHQENHTAAVAEGLAREGIDYESLSEDERVDLLTDAILQTEPVVDLADQSELSDTASRVFRRFDALGDWQRTYGPEAIDTYCISMTEEPSHVLEVLFLADQSDVVDLPDHAGIDVVPLLETHSALEGARRIMGTLFENEAYSQALSARDGTQEIMLGYSDSNKENGFLAANWRLYTNQRRLARITDEYDVELRLFHGRGGSISRGGGPMNRALLALPNETATGEVKFTEQGEAIAEKYADRRIAQRNIEQMVNAQLRARKNALEQPTDDVPEAWIEAMETMATAARQAYRELLESPGFVDYFEQATPITEIESLNLGSRPASRSGERSVEDLRAIPWVFSWTQSRCILTGWYGLATGIEAYLDDGGDLETLGEMYEEWRFFRTLVDRAGVALAESDMEVASQYADLADSDLRERFFPQLRDEHARATELVRSVVDREQLLDRDWLAESLRRRNPYVDPLHHLQIRLLERDDLSDEERRTLRLTIKGIAAGMKNTG